MKFNVILDKEQVNEIASTAADKVLATVRYHRNHQDMYEKEIEQLKLEVQKRDSMLVQKDLIIERYRERLKKMRERKTI